MEQSVARFIILLCVQHYGNSLVYVKWVELWWIGIYLTTPITTGTSWHLFVYFWVVLIKKTHSPKPCALLAIFIYSTILLINLSQYVREAKNWLGIDTELSYDLYSPNSRRHHYSGQYLSIGWIGATFRFIRGLSEVLNASICTFRILTLWCKDSICLAHFTHCIALCIHTVLCK